VDQPGQAQSDEPPFSSIVLQGTRDLLHALSAAGNPTRGVRRGLSLPAPGIGDHIPSRYLNALGFEL
jgi:hypothetical protein